MPATERTRITVSLTAELVRALDARVDGITLRNRSHAAEILLAEALSVGSISTAVLMAGGEKATQKVGALLDALTWLEQEGVQNRIVALGSSANEVQNAIRAKLQSQRGVEFVRTELGTAGVLRELRQKFSQAPFLVIDHPRPSRVSLSDLHALHRKRQAMVTVASDSLTSLEGVYLCEPGLISHIPSGFSMLTTDIFPELATSGTLVQYPALYHP